MALQFDGRLVFIANSPIRLQASDDRCPCRWGAAAPLRHFARRHPGASLARNIAPCRPRSRQPAAARWPIPLRYPVDGAKNREARKLDVVTLEFAGPQAVLDQAADAAFELIPFADILLSLIRPEAFQIGLQDAAKTVVQHAVDMTDKKDTKLFACRAVRGHRLFQRAQTDIHAAHVALVQNVLLVLEVVVQIALRHPKFIGDVLDGERRKPRIPQHVADASKDGFPALAPQTGRAVPTHSLLLNGAA